MFETNLSREFLEEKLSKLQKKTYNQFIWWRRYQSRQTLHPYKTLYEKIQNGDYENSDYYYQAEHENYLLEDAISGMKYYEDKLEKVSLFRTRHKKLQEDYLKEETEIMIKMKKDFRTTFKISKEDLDTIMESFDGTTLDLYNHIKELTRDSNKSSKPVSKVSVLQIS